ncbi:hypothetical protein V8E53_000148 [Lactarius tabidus]
MHTLPVCEVDRADAGEQRSIDVIGRAKASGDVGLIQANASRIVKGFIGLQRCVCNSESIGIPGSSATVVIPDNLPLEEDLPGENVDNCARWLDKLIEVDNANPTLERMLLFCVRTAAVQVNDRREEKRQKGTNPKFVPLCIFFSLPLTEFWKGFEGGLHALHRQAREWDKHGKTSTEKERPGGLDAVHGLRGLRGEGVEEGHFWVLCVFYEPFGVNLSIVGDTHLHRKPARGIGNDVKGKVTGHRDRFTEEARTRKTGGAFEVPMNPDGEGHQLPFSALGYIRIPEPPLTQPPNNRPEHLIGKFGSLGLNGFASPCFDTFIHDALFLRNVVRVCTLVYPSSPFYPSCNISFESSKESYVLSPRDAMDEWFLKTKPPPNGLCQCDSGKAENPESASVPQGPRWRGQGIPDAQREAGLQVFSSLLDVSIGT